MYLGLTLACGILAWSYSVLIGANDAANVLGVTVGAGSLSSRPALLLLVTFQAFGSFVAGQEVAKNSRKKYFMVDAFEGQESQLLTGIVSAFVTGCIVLLVMTYREMPVSTTHTIATPLIVMTLLTVGADAINWMDVGQLFVGWFVSPLSGILVASLLDVIISKTVLVANIAESRARIMLPIVFGLTLFVFPIYVSISISHFSSNLFYVYIISGALGLFAVISSFVFFDQLIHLAMRISPLIEQSVVIVSHHVLKYGSSEDLSRKVDRLGAERVFCILQLVAGALFSFCHGANDIANSIGPFSIALDIYQTDIADKDLGTIPVWLPFVLGAGMTAGVAFSGGVTRKVSKSITKLTPSGGFIVLLTAGLLVLANNAAGLRVSLTQMIVGSVVGVGISRSRKEHVNWMVIRDVVVNWVLVFPFSAIVFVPIYTFLIGVHALMHKNEFFE